MSGVGKAIGGIFGGMFGGGATSDGGGGHGNSGNAGGGGYGGGSRGYGGNGDTAGGRNGQGVGSSTSGRPVLLDLDGNGLTVDTLQTSSIFFDLDGDTFETRTAWAGKGDGVLIFDADNDGKISNSKEFAFTEWAPGANGDLDALKRAFDTNGNGKLDAGDAGWAKFKVMVDGQVKTLGEAGIASIDLTATGPGQNFEDGSAITGTTTFTRTDGTTGVVGDAILAAEAGGYKVARETVTNADGSKTTTLKGYTKDGALAFINWITVSLDGNSVTTRFDDDGDGLADRSQTDVTVISGTTRTRTVSNFALDGSLADRTETVTTGNGASVTTRIDQDGSGHYDEGQTTINAVDGSVTELWKQAPNGALRTKIVTIVSADKLTKTVKTDANGDGTFETIETEVTSITNGVRTVTTSLRSGNNTLLGQKVVVTSADGKTTTTKVNGDGLGSGEAAFETTTVTESQVGAGNTAIETSTVRDSNGNLIGGTRTVTAADGRSKTVSTDVNGDGVYDIVRFEETTIAANGSRTQTVTSKGADGTLLSSSVTVTSADGKSIVTTLDADGNGKADMVKRMTVDAAGLTTTITETLNDNELIIQRGWEQASADGLRKTVKLDVNGDGAFDSQVIDNTTVQASGARVRTIDTLNGAGTATLSRTVTTTSADGLTETVEEDLTGDGVFDRKTVSTMAMAANGVRTKTATTYAGNGTTKLGSATIVISADRLTTTTTSDLNGDGTIDVREIAVMALDGTQTIRTTEFSPLGTVISHSEKTISKDGFIITEQVDVDGDGAGNGGFDVRRNDVTTFGADGKTTRTISDLTTNGALISRTQEDISGNGLVKNSALDIDGNGTYDSRISDVTVLNADGSITRTVSKLNGAGLVLAKTITTTSADGRSITTETDVDGNGSIDLKKAYVKYIEASGKIRESMETTSGDGTWISGDYSSTSPGDKSATVDKIYVDGTKRTRTSDTLADGSKRIVEAVLGADDESVKSKTTTMISADGLTTTYKFEGDDSIGAWDRSVTTTKTVNANGSTTEFSDFKLGAVANVVGI